MSETCGLGTALRVPETYDHPDSVGDPNPGMEVQVRDPGSGAVLGDDQVGEICLRGPATFLGYWDNPEATAAALDADRWYRTGDFGHTREGLLYLQGRRRDLIIRGGENVYPIEIENRLLEHPDINEVAVIGVAHPRLGQEVKAVVVARLHTELTAEDVQAWAGQTLASFKVPTHVEFRSALPYNPAGKVMKHLLEDSGQASHFVPD
jgi:acyl-CoA synthetase (AMP-forming)/AMP-acid ligase II